LGKLLQNTEFSHPLDQLPPRNRATRKNIMLNIVSQPGGKQQSCDGVSRRRMLQIGALGTFGLNLQGLLKAEQSGLTHPAARSKKSVILV